MLISIVFAAIAVLFLANRLLVSFFDRPWGYSSMAAADSKDSRGDSSCPPSITQDPSSNLRTVFGLGSGAFVRGFPSSGGIYILEDCDGVELDFLHLDRFTTANRSDDPTVEDKHCENMRRLGAKWWSHEFEFDKTRFFAPTGPPPDEKVVVVGWTDNGGGTWILSTTRKEAIRKGIGRVKNAFNMEERCRVIKSLGGVFYADANDCADLDLRPEDSIAHPQGAPLDLYSLGST